MELLLVFAFAVVVSILFNFGGPKFAASSFGKRFTGNYAMQTLGTAIVFFAAIYVAALLMSAVDGMPKLPTVRQPLA